MPLKKLRPCNVRGCNNLTRDKYCQEHTQMAQLERKATDNYYNKNRTDKKYVSFYKTKEWKQIQMLTMIRDYGLCQECLRHGRTTFADMVHHKQPLKKRWDLRLDINNLECLCEQCHNNIDHSKL